MMDELTRAIGTMINKYPQRGFTVTELTQISGLPVTALNGILEALVKARLVQRRIASVGTTYWAMSADPDQIVKQSGAPKEDKGSVISAGAAAGLITAALAALIAELGS